MRVLMAKKPHFLWFLASRAPKSQGNECETQLVALVGLLVDV